MTEADLVFVGGTIVTVDAESRCAEALAVAGGRIAAVGTSAEIRALGGPRTRVVELEGGAVLPGINDSHLHASMLGAYWPHAWLDSFATGGGLPEPRRLETAGEREAAIRRAWDVLLPLGITSYTEPGLGPGADGQHGGSCGEGVLRTYAKLAGDDALPVRVNVLLLFGELDGPSDPEQLERGLEELELPSWESDRLRIAGVKLFADGIPPMRTAWVGEPYEGGGHGGLLVRGSDDTERAAALTRMVAHAHRLGHQVGVHATGDRAIDASVDAFRAAIAATGGSDARHYVIHGDCVSPATLAAMAAAGIGLNAQPEIFAATAPLLEAALGPRRATAAFPLRSALDAGVPLALGSDGPVTIPDWRHGVAAAALRRGVDGVSRGEEQRLATLDAIRAYTLGGARQDRAEGWKGSLEVGKIADLCVLAADPLRVPPEELPDVAVTMTVVGGDVAFEA